MRRVKNVIFLLPMLALLAAIGNLPGEIPVASAFPTGAAVSVNAPEQVAAGGNFTATIDIQGVADLNAAQYDITFNSTVLQLNDITSGNISGTSIPVMYNQVSTGTYRVVNSLGTANVTGSGTLATLQFNASGADAQSSSISRLNGVLSGLTSGRLPATWSADSVVLHNDLTPPTVIATLPAPGADSVPRGASIQVTFSEAVEHTSVERAFSISPAIGGVFTWSGNAVTFEPSGNLEGTTNYMVTIGTGATDNASPANHLATAYSLSFTTQRGCLIFTAAYGSPLAKEVKLLQEFRAGTGSGTGRGFFNIFNSIYYSFSPQAAGFISSSEPVRNFARVALTPLVWTAEVSARTANLLSAVNPEAGMLLSLVLAGALAGIIYVTPLLLAACTAPRRYRRARAGSRVRAVELALFVLLLVCLALWGAGMSGTGSFLATVLACGLASILAAHAIHNSLVGRMKAG